MARGVRGVSIDELDRLGINEKTGRLYWDGDEVVMRTEFAFSVAAQNWEQL